MVRSGHPDAWGSSVTVIIATSQHERARLGALPQVPAVVVSTFPSSVNWRRRSFRSAMVPTDLAGLIQTLAIDLPDPSAPRG